MSARIKTRAATAATSKPVVGLPGDAVADRWALAFSTGEDTSELLAFNGKPQLPTRSQALSLYLHVREANGQWYPANKILDIVTTEVSKYWTMGNIPMKLKKKVKEKVQAMVDEYRDTTRNLSRRCEVQDLKRQNFQSSLGELFDVAAADAEKIMRADRALSSASTNDDINFLRDQRSARTSWMQGADMKYTNARARKMKREEKVTERHAELLMEKEEKLTKESCEDMEVDLFEDDNKDEDYVPQKKSEQNEEYVTINVPKKIFNHPEVVAAMDRTRCSNSAAVAIVAAVLKSGGADLAKFSISKTTVKTSRDMNRAKTADRVRHEFQLQKPRHVSLHWDGKLLRTVAGVKEDRLAVLVSGAPHYKEGKLLGIPPMKDENGRPTSTGSAMFQYVRDLVTSWDVKDNIRAVSFDTTAANTGCTRGAATRLEAFLDRRVLWLACRHHVSELVQSALWSLLFTDDQGPDNAAYQAVKAAWPDMDTSPAAPFKKLVIRSPVLLELKAEAVNYLTDVLSEHSSQVILRDDYDELARTSLSLLGVVPPGGMKWMKPGASHKARFMANAIYSNKMLAFHAALDYDQDTVGTLRRFVQFNCLLYVPHFLKAGIGADAALNDLRFCRQLMRFRAVDREMADAALKVIRRHRWYLSQEVAIFCLFSGKVSADEKVQLAARLLSCPVPEDFPLGAPEFPDIDETTELVDLIGPNSWSLFAILGTGTKWLNRSPDTWPDDPHYQEAAAFVKTVKVTNDVAERGVKMITDYLEVLTKDDETRQQLLQGVELHRQKFPDFSKKTLKSSF